MSERPFVPYNPEVAEHLASGNEALAQSYWKTSAERDNQAALAAAHFAAATAKAIAFAVYDVDVNAAVEDVMRERHERRRAARERMGR